jgi:anti-anti-sigma factor
MDLTTTTDGALATLAVVGTIDTRASGDFESALVKAVEGGARHVIVDFSRLDLITSSGIRVLVLFAKRLSAKGGGFVLCCLSADVRRVFDIAGLSGQFRIVPTRADAIATLTTGTAPEHQTRGSRVTRLVGSLLGGRSEPPKHGAPADAAARSPLSKQVAQLLAESSKPPQP